MVCLRTAEQTDRTISRRITASALIGNHLLLKGHYSVLCTLRRSTYGRGARGVAYMPVDFNRDRSASWLTFLRNLDGRLSRYNNLWQWPNEGLKSLPCISNFLRKSSCDSLRDDEPTPTNWSYVIDPLSHHLSKLLDNGQAHRVCCHDNINWQNSDELMPYDDLYSRCPRTQEPHRK